MGARTEGVMPAVSEERPRRQGRDQGFFDDSPPGGLQRDLVGDSGSFENPKREVDG